MLMYLNVIELCLGAATYSTKGSQIRTLVILLVVFNSAIMAILRNRVQVALLTSVKLNII